MALADREVGRGSQCREGVRIQVVLRGHGDRLEIYQEIE